MRIEEYFSQIQDIIAACLWVETSSLTFDQRTTTLGYIRGDLYFRDGSTLHLREYVETETAVERIIYAYQYMDADQSLIFRYDNAGHHRRLKLPTYPHHKHDGSEENVIASPAPDLAQILDEITARIENS